MFNLYFHYENRKFPKGSFGSMFVLASLPNVSHEFIENQLLISHFNTRVKSIGNDVHFYCDVNSIKKSISTL